jgi:hypothetical protein
MKMDLEQFIESCEKSEEIKFILLKIYEISLKEFNKEKVRIQTKGRSEYTYFEIAELSVDTTNFPYLRKYDFDLWMKYFITHISESCNIENRLKMYMIEISSGPTHTINESIMEETFIIEMEHYINYSTQRTLRYVNTDYLFKQFIKTLIKDFTPQIIQNIKDKL